MTANVDEKTVAGFGDEWSSFDQSGMMGEELDQQFARYFAVFPWHLLPPNATGVDIGCGSGRWALKTAERVGFLHCVDASDAALSVAQRNLSHLTNVAFHHASVEAMPIADESLDFGYSLGVLHHIPDTEQGLRAAAAKLKPGSPFLVYLYYSFDNRPVWFRIIWKLSDVGRGLISRLPFGLKRVVTDLIAATVYFPLAKTAAIAEKAGFSVGSLPLSTYRRHSFYTMRTDALDRFGTRLEQRFSKVQIEKMMVNAGFADIKFSDEEPFWCAVGIRS